MLSIITICRNDAANLARTMASVFAQTLESREYIVIDGGSTDTSQEVIQRCSDRIAYWVSEPDGGIADAFNKGLAAARGDWVQFLNAGDCYCSPLSAEIAAAHFADHDIVSGFANFGTSTIPTIELRNEHPLDVRSRLSHQASFVRRQVFLEVGGFDTSFQIRMDYEFWLRALQEHRFCFLPRALVDYDPGGLSGQNPRLFYAEERRANKMHLENWLLPNLKTYALCLRELFM